ncbi:conserved hypothetical protein [Vibrio crassostreae]|uniref:hypothetical protein n=1 Tax=Vibrio crassostreae TaxID=246167 RepID=UPI00148CB472|nr:hypothetical protein [Vibrio crassostreae]NOI55396.1 hypothetical protein [Vibrio crassostreae]CAK1692546.1 conserved hypothetical protein [Vibrio crassostreae]CAK1693445.1 conserved hypothetical protein [Vibrio crassostreae]CAK1709259.1 conserved hypothetical protein [Vibrio crassostreae]CAK1709287.1 conserved hypothetical protein [Vibrio crassostreae]
MAQQHTTPTLSKSNFSDQRFAAGHESSPKNDISKSVHPVGLSRDIALSESKPVEVIVVIAAHVKARARHSSVWIELTVLFPETELNKPYWGQGIARGHVITETNKVGLNSRAVVIGWVTDSHQYIEA